MWPRNETTVESVVRWTRGSRAPGAAGLLIWFIPLVIGPVTGAVDATDWWLAWPALLVASACWFVAIGSAYREDPPPYVAAASLTLMCGISTIAVVASGDAWAPLFILANIGVGITARSRWAVPAIVGVTALSAGAAWFGTNHWDATWTTALPTFLSGISTFWFCLLLAVIGELARTREELADVAVSQERLRFSRDLHDLLGHTLSVIVVKAEVVRRLTRSDPAAEHAADIETIGRRALTEVRQAASSFRGMTLAGELVRARVALDAAGIELVSPDRPPELPPPVDDLFGWVVREAVTNVVRHSGARRCTIAVAVRRDEAVVEVSDDGSQGEGSVPGGGLQGLRERADAVHGELLVAASADGLTLSVRAPTAELVGRR